MILSLNGFQPEGLFNLGSYLMGESERYEPIEIRDAKGTSVGTSTKYEFSDGVIVYDVEMNGDRFLNVGGANGDTRRRRAVRLSRLVAGLEFFESKNDRKNRT